MPAMSWAPTLPGSSRANKARNARRRRTGTGRVGMGCDRMGTLLFQARQQCGDTRTWCIAYCVCKRVTISCIPQHPSPDTQGRVHPEVVDAVGEGINLVIMRY